MSESVKPITSKWWDQTWNPVTGCTPVSSGCANCWAKRMHARKANGKPFSEITVHADRLEQPLHWRKPRRVAVCLMGDLFHKDAPDDTIDNVFAVMALCPQHMFYVLTKRIEQALEYYSRGNCSLYPRETDVHIAMEARGWQSRDDILTYAPPGSIVPDDPAWPLPNVWLGTSVEDQATADERIPHLLKCPAAMRFISIEPMLGSVHIPLIRPLADMSAAALDAGADRESTGIQWVIVGSESGPGARPMDLAWVRSIRNQCCDAGVPLFFKQRMEERTRINMPELDGVVYDKIPVTFGE